MENRERSAAGQAVLDWLEALEPGDGRDYDGLVVFPVFPGKTWQAPPGPLEYRTLAEAMAEGWVEVTEKAAATVPELVLRNRGKAMVLVLDGEEIVGGKQNRIVNASFLVAAGSEVVIPVTCVEHGRWHDVAPKFAPGESSYFSLKLGKQAQVAASLRATGRHDADQPAVWSEIARRSREVGAQSPTGAMEELYRARRQPLSEYDRHLPYLPEAVGLVVAMNGRLAGAEVFDQPRTAAVLWAKLVRSYALDAMDGEPGAPVERSRAVRFLERARAAQCEVYSSLALGEDVRLQGDGVVGAALVYRETAVHVSLFRMRRVGSHEAGATGMARSSVRRGFRGG